MDSAVDLDLDVFWSILVLGNLGYLSEVVAEWTLVSKELLEDLEASATVAITTLEPSVLLSASLS